VKKIRGVSYISGRVKVIFHPIKKIILYLQKSFGKVFVVGDESSGYELTLVAHRVFQ
jgi:hypothetical protein